MGIEERSETLSVKENPDPSSWLLYAAGQGLNGKHFFHKP